ncbi:MAG: hypothetical protein HDR17_15705 [Lachnospiraceae bacterium]|nr:hypothetical protein [Lachnospiraceae bacterium]MBD5505532.1 hypothetical protein [Lachnospiraceae bacterium]
MLRSLMQVYVKGSIEAVNIYQKAFNAEILGLYPDDNGGYMHSELNAYEVLKDGAIIHVPIGPCDYSPCMFSLVDKFGVFWCLFV